MENNIKIPDDVWEKTSDINDKRLKIESLIKKLLPDWEINHYLVCLKESHGKCMVPDYIVDEWNMMLREMDKMNIEIIELQRPYAEHDENWKEKAKSCRDAYDAWSNKYDKKGM